ncbi:hypothetical protein AC1031_014001 [Aphanomyces cochlioides]|nr:hypothetical protein AC1031_014001 [Aphanomyces cochlioides]
MGNAPSNEEHLIQAAASGDLNNVRVLLENGANITFADTSGETALHTASRNGHLDIVKELIARDAPHDLVDKDGMTPLNRASCNGRLAVVKELLAHGASIHVANNANIGSMCPTSHSYGLEWLDSNKWRFKLWAFGCSKGVASSWSLD